MENESLLKAKENFVKNGYCTFSLDSIDLDFTEFLKEHLMCSPEKNLQKIFSSFRYDSYMVETTFRNGRLGYDNLEKIKQFLYDLEPDKNLISQIWYSNGDWESINDFLKTKNLEKVIENALNKIIYYLYNLEGEPSLNHKQLQLSYYNKNCRFNPHKDGKDSQYICSILIYLNKDYDSENGGLLILGDSKITPEFGTIAIMDRQRHDIYHGVTEVIDGPGRYAILSFPEFVK